MDQEEYVFLENEGVRLTDNLLVRFTPINLWKAIWFEHKVIFTLIYSAIGLLVGGGIIAVVKFLEWAIARVYTGCI